MPKTNDAVAILNKRIAGDPSLTKQVEQELATGLRKRKIAELVENDEVEPGETIGEPPLTARSTLGF